MGIMQYRGHNIADFWETADFEDTTHLLVWERWPTAAERETLRKNLVRAAQDIPESAVRVMQAFPCVSHNAQSPMAYH